MDTAINFYELKTRLADLGFSEPALVDALREAILTAEYAVISAGYQEMIGEQRFTGWFEFHRDMESGMYELEQYQVMLYDKDRPVADMMLDKDISKTEALKVLRTQLAREEPDQTLYWPMTRKDMEIYLATSPVRELGTAENAIQKLIGAGFSNWKDDEDMPRLIRTHQGPLYVSDEYLIDGKRLVLEWKISTEQDNKILEKLDASLVRTNILHGLVNGIDTAKLEKQMEAVNWHIDYAAASRKMHADAQKKIDHINQELKQLNEGPDRRGLPIAEQLTVKYWLATPIDDWGGLPKDVKERYVAAKTFDHLETLDNIYEQLIKQQIMNTQNLEFLKKSLLNLGFGEKVNEQLEKNINEKVPEFNLMAQHEFNQKKVDYTLHFKAGENQEMYFFNKFDATLNKGKEKEMNQTFYINKGNGITAKEAFNLMEGRAVHKQLFNKDGEKYQAWLQLDNDNLTKNGNKEIKKFNENYGFDIEQVISGKGIKEMATAEGQENLFRSLKKGNLQQITVERDGGEKKYFIATSPQYKTVDLFDHQMKKIKREELLKPEQKQGNSQKQHNSQKQGRQQREELPEKKQRAKRKITV